MSFHLVQWWQQLIHYSRSSATSHTTQHCYSITTVTQHRSALNSIEHWHTGLNLHCSPLSSSLDRTATNHQLLLPGNALIAQGQVCRTWLLTMILNTSMLALTLFFSTTGSHSMISQGCAEMRASYQLHNCNCTLHPIQWWCMLHSVSRIINCSVTTRWELNCRRWNCTK